MCIPILFNLPVCRQESINDLQFWGLDRKGTVKT